MSACLKLVGFCDSDGEGNPNYRHFTSGHCFEISDGSCFICMSFPRQQTVALSSTETDCVIISLASQECVYPLSLVNIIDVALDGAVLLRGDNEEAFKLAQSSRSKHIDIRYQFVRDLVEREVLQLPTDQNNADFLTKTLGGPKFNQILFDLFSQSVAHHLGGVLKINETVHFPRSLQACWSR